MLPSDLSRAAPEPLPGSRPLEMLSHPPASELRKTAEGEVGYSFVRRFFNPPPILYPHTLPPSMALGLVALLWNKCSLLPLSSFLCLSFSYHCTMLSPLLNLYQNFPATDALSLVFVFVFRSFEYFLSFSIISMQS